MIHIITGHRGGGKSRWLKTISHIYGKKALCFDLDQEVEKEAGKSIRQIFQEEGEKGFRRREREAFARLLKNAREILVSVSPDRKVFIAVGAGLIFKKEKDMRVIFLRRVTDSAGRVFLNRPRLSKGNTSPFEEYLQLYKKRMSRYKRQADETLFRMEHFKGPQLSDRVFLGEQKIPRPFFILRLNPADLPKHPRRLKDFLEKRREWGARFFELNDETADPGFTKKILSLIPAENILFSSSRKEKSFQNDTLACKNGALAHKTDGKSEGDLIGDRKISRKPHKENKLSVGNSLKLTPKNIFQNIKNKPHYSWDLKLGAPPKEATVLSLHERGGRPLKKILREFSRYKKHHLKLAVKIVTLRELWEGLQWQRKDPLRRSFLPRSQNGRWRWFRNGFPMPLHFIREGDSEVLDQPFFTSACHYRKKAKALAGVIGDPVDFSATPAQHNSFFYRKRSIPVLPVPLKEEEMIKKNLEIFRKMGFVFFAVTSPLKKKAFHSADIVEKKARELKSVNLLIFHKGKWRGYNTDVEGLNFLQKDRGKNVVVWGGGGVLDAIKKHLPKACFYSARRGVPSLPARQGAPSLSTRRGVPSPSITSRDIPYREQKSGNRQALFSSPADKTASLKLNLPEKGIKTRGKKIKTDTPGRVTNGRALRRIKTHEKKIKSNTPPLPVDVLIWAIGRSHIKRGCLWPPEEWRPTVVRDLNYTDDSPGREYALKTGAVYKSGRAFFKAQAKKQQEIFAGLEKQNLKDGK